MTAKQLVKVKFPAAKVVKFKYLNYPLWQIMMGDSVIGESIKSCGDAWKVASDKLNSK